MECSETVDIGTSSDGLVGEIFGAEGGGKDPSVPLSPYTSLTGQPETHFGSGVAWAMHSGLAGVMRLDLGLPTVSSPKCTPASTILRKILETVD